MHDVEPTSYLDDIADSDNESNNSRSSQTDEQTELAATSQYLGFDIGDREQGWSTRLSPEKIEEEMSKIDMDDAEDIEQRISNAMSAELRQRFTLTSEVETQILSLVLGEVENGKSWQGSTEQSPCSGGQREPPRTYFVQ